MTGPPLHLAPMDEATIARYREQVIDRFAADKTAAEGAPEEIARREAEAAWERAAPKDANDPDHVLAELVDGGEPVGVMWFAVRPESGRPCLWLYDIRIDGNRRGQGLGRRAMALLEDEATRRGVSSIGLHVFGHNTVARGLYEKLGFRTTSIVMRKDLGD